jgi:hypothetical protein
LFRFNQFVDVNTETMRRKRQTEAQTDAQTLLTTFDLSSLYSY